MADPTHFSNLPGTDPGPYVAALLELLADDDPLEVLAATPPYLRQVAAEMDPASLRAPEREGKWSVLEVLAHLADSEVVYSWRLRRMIAEERPRLGGYDQDAWARALGYREADAGEAVERFTVLRRANLALLRGLGEEGWQRVAVHEERGEETVRHLSRLYAGHDRVHRRQIERIRRALGALGKGHSQAGC